MQYFFEIITCDPSLYTKDLPDFIVCSFMEHFIGLKKVVSVNPLYNDTVCSKISLTLK